MMQAHDFARRLAAEGHMAQIYRAVEPAYPHEGCGFVFELPDGTLQCVGTANRAEELHRKDPEAYPRSGGDWFEPDMKPWFRAVREGATPRAIFHSHPDEAAYFSSSDHDSAVFVDDSGTTQERNPGVWHIVVSVLGGGAVGAGLFEFDAATGAFARVAAFDVEGRTSA